MSRPTFIGAAERSAAVIDAEDLDRLIELAENPIDIAEARAARPPAAKQLSALPKGVRTTIARVIDAPAENPRPHVPFS